MLYKNAYIPIFKKKKYIKFLISGFSATLVNLFALYVFHGVLGLQIVVATSLSFVIAFFVSFTLQKFWTFADASQDRLTSQMFRYLLVGLMGLSLNAGGMYLLVEVWFWFYIFAQLFMSAGIAVINYLMYRLIFDKNKIEDTNKKPCKNILIATGIYPPDLGGPATYSRVLKDELSSKGFEIKIVCYGESESEDNSRNIFRISRGQNKFFRYLEFFKAVWREAKWADLVYVQGPVSEGLPSYLACRLRRKRYILKVVGDFAWEQASQRSGVTDLLDDFQNKNYSLRVELWRLVEIFVAHGAQSIIVPSGYLKKIVMSWGIDSNDINVIYNSVELVGAKKNKAESRNELGVSGRVVLSAGRLVPWKGFPALIETIADLSSKYNDIRLYIAGDGPDRERLKQEVEKNSQSERVIFLGSLSHDELGKYMESADLFVLNTSYEGMSHVLIEAIHFGLPIVTTNVGGNPELINNQQSGLLVPYNDKPALTAAIDNIFSNYDQALERAEEAKKNLYKFSKPKMIEDLLSVINKISP